MGRPMSTRASLELALRNLQEETIEMRRMAMQTGAIEVVRGQAEKIHKLSTLVLTLVAQIQGETR